MKICPINNYSRTQNYIQKTKHSNNINNSIVGSPARVSFYGIDASQRYELAYSLKELEDRTSPEKLVRWELLTPDATSYKNLDSGDKKSLVHLVKAAEQFDAVYKRLDSIHNLEFEKYLNLESAKGNKKAILTKKLYDGQKSLAGLSTENKPVNLAKNIKLMPGMGFYPEDLKEKEFHSILINMLNEGKIEEVKNILNQRSIVKRDGEYLKAIAYTEFFKKNFTKAADELELAAKTSTNKDFNDYLKLQARALRDENPQLDCLADTKWATLQDTPLEFTVIRESYDDRMTPTVFKNSVLKGLLEKHNIPVYAKDALGGRVGIVDKEGTKFLLKIKEHLPYMAKSMPFSDRYKQIITNNSIKQTMVDADIVYMSGYNAAYNGGIGIAQNLPNGDKLAVQTGGGFRNVYHKQLREAKYTGYEKILDALLNKSQHKYFSPAAIHNNTIFHENLHTLGPKEGLQALGLYRNIIEEHKADMGAFSMMDKLSKKGVYTPEQMKQSMVSDVVVYFRKGPELNDAHVTRNIMQNNYYIKRGAITFDKEGKMLINFEKYIECANEMLENAIRIQLSKSEEKAAEYVKKWSEWTPELDRLATKLKMVDVRLNSYLDAPLAKVLLKMV